MSRSKIHDAAGITENWPEGRGIFVSSNKTVVVKVNFEDHIEVTVLEKEGQFDVALNKLSVVLDIIAEEVDPYSQHSKLGYLNASPVNLGHAFSARVQVVGEVGAKIVEMKEKLDGLQVSEDEPN